MISSSFRRYLSVFHHAWDPKDPNTFIVGSMTKPHQVRGRTEMMKEQNRDGEARGEESVARELERDCRGGNEGGGRMCHNIIAVY